MSSQFVPKSVPTAGVGSGPGTSTASETSTISFPVAKVFMSTRTLTTALSPGERSEGYTHKDAADGSLFAQMANGSVFEGKVVFPPKDGQYIATDDSMVAFLRQTEEPLDNRSDLGGYSGHIVYRSGGHCVLNQGITSPIKRQLLHPPWLPPGQEPNPGEDLRQTLHSMTSLRNFWADLRPWDRTTSESHGAFVDHVKMQECLTGLCLLDSHGMLCFAAPVSGETTEEHGRPNKTYEVHQYSRPLLALDAKAQQAPSSSGDSGRVVEEE